MMSKDYSEFQKGVIDRYYKNLDGIMLQKLQELCTDLYLAKDGPKEDKLWERVEKAMVKLKVPRQIMENIMRKRNVVVLTRNVEEWLKRVKK